MKLFWSSIIAVVVFITFMTEFNLRSYSKEAKVASFHGVWVSTVFNIDFPSKKGLSTEEWKKEADTCLDTVQALGLNAIFLQVRPMGDAIYPSKLYPWSAFLSGQQGQGPQDGFDPLAWWVEGAHRRGIELHAWVNPYRVTSGKVKKEDLAPNNPALLHPEWTFEYNGKLFLNPGLPEVRKYVINGIQEIVRNYEVDGIHLDDYFYPARKLTQDEKTFKKYGKGFDNIEDWRRHNVDLLIQGIHKGIKRIKPQIDFGVSPAGIWANKVNNALGSETQGNETYYNMFADTRGWVKKEWIDYITPQIYWHIGFKIADFKTLVDWWNDVVDGTKTKLYIGMAAYRVDPHSTTPEWTSSDELIRQFDYILTKKQVNGFVLFTMHNIKSGTEVNKAIQEYKNSKHKKDTF